ncbi:MAG: hypothetical protein WCX93_13750 [Burkholderiaceae bacterium]
MRHFHIWGYTENRQAPPTTLEGQGTWPPVQSEQAERMDISVILQNLHADAGLLFS